MNIHSRSLIIVAATVIAVTFGLAAPESRVAHAASLTVNSTADTDDGTCDLANCTLREAINEANANGTNDIIAFSFPGVGPFIIQPASQLPTITERVTITGSFTTGYAPLVPVVWIDGSLAGAGASGFVIASNNSQIYGLAIYDFDSVGVYIDGGNSNMVAQSVIGTNALEQASVGNEVGVLINNGSSNGVGFAPSERNIISGNGTGVRIFGTGGGNFINDNYIGLKRDGATPLGNYSGVYVDTAPGVYVLNNVISGNEQGIAIEDDAGVTIENNKIGLNAAGTAFVPNNLRGIYFFLASGTGSLQMNQIRGNGGPGIALAGSSGLHSQFTNNVIDDNAGLGIDIGYDGVTANDPGDADGGPNGSQNYPVITGVTTALGSTTVQASLHSTPSTSFAVDFYASTYCDASGHGEGHTYLGSHFPMTNASGDVSFTANLGIEAAPGSSVTATATGPEGTSEFSLCFDIPLDPDDDQDLDGCTNGDEIGPDEEHGGQRDPENPWDFYDINGTQKVDGVDIGLVRSKFNQDYPPYDRSPGAAPWAPDGPDGIVNGIDVGLVRTEFNHDCRPDM